MDTTADVTNAINVINVILFFALVALMVNNRYNINNLKKDMNKYIEKDLSNLKRILEVTMHNDKKLEKKTDFILNVLEEDNKVDYVPSEYGLTQLSDEVDVTANSKSWIDNILTNNEFKKLINGIN